MRRLIIAAVIVAVAAMTTAWSLSMLPRPNAAKTTGTEMIGVGWPPERTPPLW